MHAFWAGNVAIRIQFYAYAYVAVYVVAFGKMSLMSYALCIKIKLIYAVKHFSLIFCSL